MVHNASYSKPIEVQVPHDIGRWPEITLVRRTDTGTVHKLSELSKVVPDDEMLPYDNQESNLEPDREPRDVEDAVTPDVAESNVVVEETNNNANNEPTDSSGAALASAAQAAAPPKAHEEEELPPYSEDDEDGNKDHSDKEGSGGDKEKPDAGADSSFEVLEDDDDVFETSKNGNAAENKTDNNNSNKNDVSQVGEKPAGEKDDLPEEILSGNIHVPGVPVSICLLQLKFQLE